MAIKTDERETILISFIGMERCDIVYYVARILNAADKNVLIVDNTINHGIFNSLRKPEGEEMARVGNISAICNKKFSEFFFNCYDYVLIYHGMNLNEELCEVSDFRYVVSNFSPFMTKKVAGLINKINENLAYYVILREKVYDKISEKLILSELSLKDVQVKEVFHLLYSDTDYICYMNLLRNGSQQPKSTSSDMKNYLKSVLLTVMPEASKKERDKLFKKAMTGKIK